MIKVTMSKGVLVDWRRSSDERSAMRLLMAVGNCLAMLGGWFECLLMYNGSSLGFLYGLCFALISRKFKFTSVIFRSNCSKILCNSFLVLSIVNGRICFL